MRQRHNYRQNREKQRKRARYIYNRERERRPDKGQSTERYWKKVS